MFKMSIGIMNGEPSRPLGQKNLVLFFDCGKAANAGPDEDADLVAVNSFQVQAGIDQSLMCRRHAELREAVGPPDFLG
jgi:hypothetical protein